MKFIGGVISNNQVEFLHDEMFDSDGMNLDYHSHTDNIVSYLKPLEDYLGEPSYKEVVGFVLERVNDEYTSFDDTYLIGFIKCGKEEAWYWFDNLAEGYKPDPEAEYSAVVGEMYTQIVASKYWINAHHCSPCYPNQGDVETEGCNPTYMLPPDVVGDMGFDRRGDIKEKDIANAT